MFGESVIVKDSKNQSFVKGFAVRKLKDNIIQFPTEFKQYVSEENTCLKENVSLKKGLSVFL